MGDIYNFVGLCLFLQPRIKLTMMRLIILRPGGFAALVTYWRVLLFPPVLSRGRVRAVLAGWEQSGIRIPCATKHFGLTQITQKNTAVVV